MLLACSVAGAAVAEGRFSMLKRLALSTGLAALLLTPAALADPSAPQIVAQSQSAAEGPPIAGSVENFSRIDPSLPTPDDGFADLAGHPLTLADFRGKYVLLNLWATWCPPCVSEMPSLDRLQAKLGGAKFVVLPLSIDRGGVTEVTDFYDSHQIHHLGVYVDPSNRLGRRMSVGGLPTSFLLGPDGRAVGSLVGATNWDTPEAIALIKYYLKNGPKAAPAPVAPAPTPTITPTSFRIPAQRVGMGFSPL
jgi:thiol-disulfide isomerase/thioredoxin